jgi:hypothetical protein
MTKLAKVFISASVLCSASIAAADTAPTCVPSAPSTTPVVQGSSLLFCDSDGHCTSVDVTTKALATAKKPAPTAAPAADNSAIKFGTNAQAAQKANESSAIVSSDGKFAIINDEVWNIGKDANVPFTLKDKMIVSTKPVAIIGNLVVWRLTKSAGKDFGVFTTAGKKVGVFVGYTTPVKFNDDIWLAATRDGVIRLSIKSNSAKLINLKAKSTADISPAIVDGKAVYLESTATSVVFHTMNADASKQATSFSVPVCK